MHPTGMNHWCSGYGDSKWNRMRKSSMEALSILPNIDRDQRLLGAAITIGQTRPGRDWLEPAPTSSLRMIAERNDLSPVRRSGLSGKPRWGP
jgi:hypothetical protein